MNNVPTNPVNLKILPILVLTIAFFACKEEKPATEEVKALPATPEQAKIETKPQGNYLDAKMQSQQAVFLGMFGAKDQKLGIALLSITKTKDKQYRVTGKSKLKNNICDFTGTMEVQTAKEDFELGNDAEKYPKGKITGKYRFEEDKNQSGTGIFEGKFEIVWEDAFDLNQYFWHITKNGNTAAAFNGTYKGYNSSTVYKASWGNTNWMNDNYVQIVPATMNDGQEPFVLEKYRASGWALEIDYYKYRQEGYQTYNPDQKIKSHPDYKEWNEWWKK